VFSSLFTDNWLADFDIMCIAVEQCLGFAIHLVLTVLLGILAKSVDNERSGSRNL
jgi:hypothetical protein